MKTRKRKFVLPSIGTALCICAVTLLSGCQAFGTTSGTVQLAMTDSPIAASDVTGVYLTIKSIDIHVNGNWQTFAGFSGSGQPYNLMNLQSGATADLGTASLPAGQITQIRFNLDIPQSGGSTSNPGCYVKLSDGTIKPLFVPSGAQTGYKATGNFTVPSNGSVNITADFDVQKMVVQTNNGYILRPSIRLIVSNQAGSISGTVGGNVNLGNLPNVVVYAYASGTYDSATELSPSSDNPPFENAITSATVASSGSFKLSFLAAGNYNLVVASYDGSGNLVTPPLYVGTTAVSVTAGANTTANITIP